MSEMDRIKIAKRATAEGCLAAAQGLPLHSVADAARSLGGDCWEQGWEYVTELLKGSEIHTLRQENAELRAQLARAKELQSWSAGVLEYLDCVS